MVIPKGIAACFTDCFASYENTGQCHANALHFLLSLRQKGIDLKAMAYWNIQPHEGGHFYMINVNSHARGNRHIVPREKPYDWIPLENWFSHGIVVSRMENDQVLRVKIHYANNLLSKLDECYAQKKGRLGAMIEDPWLAYESDIWEGHDAPNEIDFIKNHQ